MFRATSHVPARPVTGASATRRGGYVARCLLCLAFVALASTARAHPADEFCTADSGLDPQLCAALAAADSASPTPEARRYGGTEVQARLDRPWRQTAALYVKLGFEHIVPKGLDHILFVLALFLASTRLRPLVLQVSAFTLAHTLTLALAALGWVKVSPGIVEPLIAASIAFVAVENLFRREMSRWRPAVAFGFGLFHGLGFAGVLLDLGLPQGQFLTSLISFNVGVELGQLTVIGLAWLALHRLYRWRRFRAAVVVPASGAIALVGAFWAVQRVLA